MVYIVIEALNYFVEFLFLLIFVRCICSWFPRIYGHPAVRLIYRLTEPILAPIRRMMQKSPIGGMGIDFSPIIAYFIIILVQRFIIIALLALAQIL